MGDKDRRVPGGYLRFDDMVWPDPGRCAETQWIARHGMPSRGDLLFMASVMSAYQQLCGVPSSAKILPRIRRVLRSVGPYTGSQDQDHKGGEL